MLFLDHVLIDRRGAVGLVTFNRPAVLNALNASTIDELRRAMLELRHDADTQVVILTGAGEKAFVAGADIGELARVPLGARDLRAAGQHVFDLDRELGKP